MLKEYVLDKHHTLSSMRKIIVLLPLLILSSMPTLAQHSDFGTMYTIGASKNINDKWDIGIEGELRFYNNSQTINRYSAAIEGQYKFSEWLKMGAEYKFIYDRREEKLNEQVYYQPSYHTPKHRVSISLTGNVSWNRFSFSLRERWQYTYRPEKTTERYDFNSALWKETVVGSKAEHTLRSRFQVEYDIQNSDIDPFASIELYNKMALERTRLTFGAEYKIKQKHSFELFYRYQYDNEEVDDDDHLMHYIGLGYTYNF